MSVIEIFVCFRLIEKNMTNAALFDAMQNTPEEIPYKAAILFY